MLKATPTKPNLTYQQVMRIEDILTPESVTVELLQGLIDYIASTPYDSSISKSSRAHLRIVLIDSGVLSNIIIYTQHDLNINMLALRLETMLLKNTDTKEFEKVSEDLTNMAVFIDTLEKGVPEDTLPLISSLLTAAKGLELEDMLTKLRPHKSVVWKYTYSTNAHLRYHAASVYIRVFGASNIIPHLIALDAQWDTLEVTDKYHYDSLIIALQRCRVRVPTFNSGYFIFRISELLIEFPEEYYRVTQFLNLIFVPQFDALISRIARGEDLSQMALWTLIELKVAIPEEATDAINLIIGLETKLESLSESIAIPQEV